MEAILLGIFGFAAIAMYLVGVAYLVCRKSKEAIHLLALTTTDENRQTSNRFCHASVYTLPHEDIACMQLPQRSGMDLE